MSRRQPEGIIKDACRPLAKKNGMLFINQESKGINGLPDTKCGCFPLGSGLVDVEFKVPGKRPVEQQWRRIREIRGAGGLATWCDSVEDWEIIVGLDRRDIGRRMELLLREEDEL